MTNEEVQQLFGESGCFACFANGNTADLLKLALLARIASGSSGGLPASINTQSFTSDGTWTKPTGATISFVTLVGAGGGGGSGRRGTGARYGGGGGAGGGLILRTIPSSSLGATEAVVIGTGGSGGAAIAVDDTNGNAGTAGGSSTFAGLSAGGGGAGVGGGITNASAGGVANFVSILESISKGGSGTVCGSNGALS